MKGSVLTQEKCPSCKKPFQIIEVDYGKRQAEELVCPDCLQRPYRYFVQVYLHKKIEPDPKRRLLRIYSNTDGHPIHSYAEAEKLLARIQKEVEDGVFVKAHYQAGEDQGYKGTALLKKWMRTKQDKSSTHRRELERYLRIYYDPFFNTRDLRYLNAGIIEDFRYWLNDRQAELNYKPLSLKSQKNIMTMLRNFCRWLEGIDVITKIPRFPLIHPPKPAIKWIKKEDQLRILDAVPEIHKPVFTFLFSHPLRIGEVRALKVKDIDLRSMVVHVERAWSGRGISTRKNGKDYYIPVSPSFNSQILRDKLPEAWLFSHKGGRPYSQDWLRDIYYTACKEVGVKRIPLKNATRHSFASQAINHGVPLEKVSRALGHSSLQVTKDSYAKMEVESLRELFEGAESIRNLSVGD